MNLNLFYSTFLVRTLWQLHIDLREDPHVRQPTKPDREIALCRLTDGQTNELIDRETDR